MLTLKFGGTSMGSAECILNSAQIIVQRGLEDRLSVVVSAVAGVSNSLQQSIDDCVSGKTSDTYVALLKEKHLAICNELEQKLTNFSATNVMAELEPIFTEYSRLLSGCVSFGECPDTVHCRIMGMGELISTKIIYAVLKAKDQDVILLDSRDFIFTNGFQKEGDPDYVVSSKAFLDYKDGGTKSNNKILLFPGFVCSWIQDKNAKPTVGLLGRNGSDFSAAIIGYCLDASRVEFWSDVDGVYTADPRIVKDAILVNDMSYNEAMELSFFGSKVLHPKTLAPLAAKGIEAWSLNSQNPKARGTRIAKGPFFEDRKNSVSGISCLNQVAMISVSGTGMKGRSGTASRIFASVSSAKISVLLITQSSSEFTISFCVKKSYSEKVKSILEQEFRFEIKEGLIDPIEIKNDCAIVSVVGDGMVKNRGIAAKFLDAISSQDINILAIAQGSSERCISCVIEEDFSELAVRVSHRFFFNTSQSVEIFAFGVGTIGGALLEQIKNQYQKLLSENVDLKVICVANGRKMLLDSNGVDLQNWKTLLENSTTPTNLDEILNFVKTNKFINPVFVDCTASYDLPERYVDIINSGMSIATPNKRANSMKIDYYKKLRKVANKMHRLFLYETNVGAGLPVIDTLQNFYKSGDRLTGFSGIMSGSLSYIFGRLDEGVLFSEAVLEAKKLCFTEPDPRDDLNGMDVARKALIIAREAGSQIELEDVVINPVFPDSFDTTGTTQEFLERLPQIDEYFAEKIAKLKAENKVLRMGASIVDGKCSVGMLEVSKEHPLYGVKGGENAFVFHTERYNPIPLTVRGYGAGADVTAAGVFGDILRTVSFNMENK